MKRKTNNKKSDGNTHAGPGVGGGSSDSRQNSSGNIPMRQQGSRTIKQERLEPDSDLDNIDVEQLFGPILGDLVPSSSSTPFSSRPPSTVSFFSTGNFEEPSPIAHVENQATIPPRPPRRELFQETTSPSVTLPCEDALASSTPKKQPTLQYFFNKSGRAEKGHDPLATATAGRREQRASSSSATTSVRSPQPSPPVQNGKKRGKSGHSTSSPTSKKRKKNKNGPVAAPRRRKAAPPASRINDSGIGGDIHPNSDESRERVLSTSSDYEYNDEDEEELESVRDTVPHFSVHRLPVDQLRTRFEDDSLTEAEIIEQIMDEVNVDTKRRYKDRGGFEERILTTENSHTASEAAQADRTFGFNVVAYIQKVECQVPLLTKLGIHDKRVDLNFILFYHRKDDIYAVTIGQTWQAVQRYSCYDFPCHISGRLTSAEGNVEETTKHIAGNVRTSKATKKNATMLDQLKNVRLNVIKEVRRNSSLYGLKEFTTSAEEKRIRGSSGQVKMQMGLAYVRIKRRMDIKNLPEILDHFSKICNGEETYMPNDGRVEKHLDDFPQIRLVQHEEAQEVENSFYELIQLFMHKQHTDLIRKFDFVDKHVDDFCNAEEFKLIYNNGGEKFYDIATFTSYPTALQVLTSIRAQCGDDLAKNDLPLKTFLTRLKKNVRLQYKVRGRNEYTERRVVDLLEGEMSIYDKDFWKTMGQWWFVREEYYYTIYKEFLDLLNKPGIYVGNEFLTQPWNRNQTKTVEDYVKLYETDQHYFLPPSEEALEEMSSQPQDNQQGEDDDEGAMISNLSQTAAKESHFFDMMRICKQEDGHYAFWLFYIFDGFDAGIRDASTRITKSIEMLLKDAPTTSTKSLLQKFWEYHVRRSNYFSALFHDYEMFRQPLTRGSKVSIVVAFATRPRQMEMVGPLSHFVKAAHSESGTLTASLDREKSLLLNFNLDNVRRILVNIQDSNPKCLNEMCLELEIAPPADSENHDMELLTAKVLGLIMTNKYCTKSESVDADQPVTGKLLKIRDYTKFKLFKNDNVNKAMFDILRMFYISGFPGFLHKLECFQIHENAAKEPRLNLNFVEIK